MTSRAERVEAVAAEYSAATDRLGRLVSGLAEAQWPVRPPNGGWSIAECVEHLIKTSETYLPLLRERIDALPPASGRRDRPYRRDLVGWLLCWMLEPPARLRTRTASTFEPQHVRPVNDALQVFTDLQHSLVGLLRDGATRGAALDRAKIASPFDARAKYSVWSAFRVLPVHQRRHLWQAERVRRALGS